MTVSLSLLLSLASVLLSPANAARGEDLQRWDFWPPLPSGPHFSGQYLTSRPGGINQRRQQFETMNLFQLAPDGEHKNALLYGSVLLDPIFPQAPEQDTSVQAAFASAVAVIKSQQLVHLSPSLAITRALVLPLKVTGDNGGTEMAVVQQYSDAFGHGGRFKSHVTFGFNFYLTLDDPKFNLRHQVVVGLDRDGQHNLFQHTFSPLDQLAGDSKALICGGEAGAAGASCDEQSTKKLRILSYNVWNTNPSTEVYGRDRRWHQYAKRIDHLASFVQESRANIVGFQEVRYDGTFGGQGNHAQVQHLAQRLPGFQYVYQPAMSYLNDRSPYERIEEGPAIFSKFPIVETDFLLLSRDPNDPNDAHQRLCLHALIDVPHYGLVDIYVTHLSLSERSREQTMVEIWHYMRQGKGETQVLLGDLNAEPQSRGIEFLRGDAELLGHRTDLKDAWLEKHEEAQPRSPDLVDRLTRFTFPSDNPVKRIDFVLYRGKGHVKSCEIIGQAPTDDTLGFLTDVGMLHAQSPVYASDHRGVVAEFEA